MNKHLELVFKILLPELEKNKIDYWVYGGISIAAFVGEFIRENRDVDVFIKDSDFEKAGSILQDLCRQNDFKLSRIENRRPKIEIKINDGGKFSMIPIYQKNNIVTFLYESNYGGDEEYPIQILEKVERNIDGYKFFTPQDEFIKDKLINHIIARSDKKKRDYFKKDAKEILTDEEYKKYMM